MNKRQRKKTINRLIENDDLPVRYVKKYLHILVNRLKKEFPDDQWGVKENLDRILLKSKIRPLEYIWFKQGTSTKPNN